MVTWAAERTGVLAGLGNVIAPVMALFGLPGTAALPLVAGFMGGITAAVGSLAALPLTTRELAILGAMVGVCHATLIEGALIRRAGGGFLATGALRLVMAAIAGMVLNALL